jgi:hypothetical protein
VLCKLPTEYLSPDELLLQIHANEDADDEFLLLYNFINSFQGLESFMNGKGAPEKYAAVKAAHKRNMAALKTKIETLEQANAHQGG